MDVQEDLYKIGVVAKRTGIAHERLRAWERRYGLVPAARAGHTRFYSGAQVARLGSIKTLLDQGHAISEVIHLTDDELQRRLGLQTSLQPLAKKRSAAEPPLMQVGLIGAQLLLAYRERDDSDVDVIAEWTSAAELARQQDPLPKPDCIAIYMPTLSDQPIELIRDVYEEVPVVIVFKYATKADLERFEQTDYALLSWPATWRNVEDLILATRPPTVSELRLYSDDELLHIRSVANQAPSECVRHLTDLVGEVNDYLAHAEHCEDDEDFSATLDDIHEARTHMEQALRRLVEKHGLIVAN